MAAASSAGPSTRAGQGDGVPTPSTPAGQGDDRPPSTQTSIRVATYNVGAKQAGGFTIPTKRAQLLDGVRDNLKYLQSKGVSVVLINEIGDPKQP